MEVQLNAVERIVGILDLPQEPPAVIKGHQPPAAWPSDTGGMVFQNVTFGYHDSLPIILKGISFEIKPHQKIGVASHVSRNNFKQTRI